MLVRTLKLVEPFNLHRQHGQAQSRRQQSDAGAEGVHRAIGGARAFGKNQYACAAVGKFAGKGKALAESGALRQWKNVK